VYEEETWIEMFKILLDNFIEFTKLVFTNWLDLTKYILAKTLEYFILFLEVTGVMA
jgi:hypothetical protein